MFYICDVHVGFPLCIKTLLSFSYGLIMALTFTQKVFCALALGIIKQYSLSILLPFPLVPFVLSDLLLPMRPSLPPCPPLLHWTLLVCMDCSLFACFNQMLSHSVFLQNQCHLETFC